MDDSGGNGSEISGRRVERGLEVAFGGSGESVLDALERLNGVSSRILLHDQGGDDTPVVRMPAAGDNERVTDDSRYQVLGEIARGGVGVILKSRDRDLGRDVALKVLKKDLAQVPEVVQRFVEEAQIEGQLQHPGIVPVYGLGVQKDGRPYFAMKLVKGETLAAKIRGAGRAGRSRNVSAFEKICQTMAYAHARMVIHRDLKPANVLVGAFGEVQVVDWGFAKVLARGGVADEHREEKKKKRKRKPDFSVIETIRTGSTGSESRVGSIMGTPGYMSPEQARGDTDRIDERTDVFALGAILTEILTGKPPYVGNQGQQIHAAAKAKLRPAMQRLDKCSADPQLIDLAKQCLAPALDARPRHAGEVAEAISSYLASLEVRRRKAELRAAAERRTRKLSLALAATILIAVVLGGGGWYTADSARRTRLESARKAVDVAYREAGMLAATARSSDVDDLAAWPPAVAKAEATVHLARELGAEPEVRTEVDDFLATVRSEQVHARRRAKIAKDDRKLSEELWGVRLARHKYIKPLARNRNYDIYFHAHHVDVPEDRPEDVAAWIAERTIRDEIVAVLDDWTWRRRAEKKSMKRLRSVLDILDPDELRGKIRDAGEGHDLTKLRLIVTSHELAELPPETLLLLGETFGNCGEASEAADVYRVLVEQEPESFRANAGLGYWVLLRSPPKPQEAVDCLRRALEVRKSCIPMLRLLAQAFYMQRDSDSSLVVLRQVLALEPDLEDVARQIGAALWKRAVSYRAAGNSPLAVRTMRDAVDYLSRTTSSLVSFGTMLQEAGFSAEAEEIGQEVLRRESDNWNGHLIVAGARRGLGRPDEALASYRRAEVLAPRSSRVQMDKGKAHAQRGDLDEAVHCWERGARLQGGYPLFFQYIAGARDRQGRYDEAIEATRKAIELSPVSAPLQVSLAILLRRAGRIEEAEATLEAAIRMETERIAGLAFCAPGQYVLLGNLLGRREESREAVRRFDESFPDAEADGRAFALSGIAVCAQQCRGDLAGARRLLLDAVREAPECGQAWINLASAHLSYGECGEALRAAAQGARLMQGTGGSLPILIQALSACGQFRDARRFTQRLAQDMPYWARKLENLERLEFLVPRVQDIVSGRLRPRDVEEELHFGNALSRRSLDELAWEHYTRFVANREPNANALLELQSTQAFAFAMASTALRVVGRTQGAVRELWLRRLHASLERALDAIEGTRKHLVLESWGQPWGGEAMGLKFGLGWAPIRDPRRIAQMPEDLREGFTEFWKRVDDLWRRAR